MDKKFELTENTIKHSRYTLYQIRALKDFGNVKAGDLGGYVQKEENLSQSGNCWLYDESKAYNNAKVLDNAKMSDKSEIFNDATIEGNANASENCKISENAKIHGKAKIHGNCKILGNADVKGYSRVGHYATVCDNVKISGHARVYGSATICENADVSDKTFVQDHACISGHAKLAGCLKIIGKTNISDDAIILSEDDYVFIKGFCDVYDSLTFFRCKNDEIKVNVSNPYDLCVGGYCSTLESFKNTLEQSKMLYKQQQEGLFIADLIEYHFKKREIYL